jgi:trk system potassium uptake protein TrkA
MHVVIAGCGRVGSGLARQLAADGWHVAIIDEDAEAFSLLGDDFPGDFVTGPALDWEVLRAAGLEKADAFVACTDGDNTNIVVTQVAEKKFGVTCSVARVYDPLRADLFAQAGVRTVCPTKDARELLLRAVESCDLRPKPAED